MSWLEEANFQMLRDHQCVLVWVDACMHDKAFAKSWAFGSNSSKVQALQARCNHPHKHQSIAGVKEQGVYLSTLTAEYPPSLALQLAQIGIGRVSKTGSFRLALPLHSNCPNTVTLAPCRLPTCDGAGMHSSADWCLPKPKHPLQAVAKPWPCPSDMSPEAGQPYRLHLLHALAKSWGDPDGPPSILAARSADRSRISLTSKPSMASKEARLHAAAGSGNL